eukprot:jgi/Ulvmu1/7874/UM004_0105.1
MANTALPAQVVPARVELKLTFNYSEALETFSAFRRHVDAIVAGVDGQEKHVKPGTSGNRGDISGAQKRPAEDEGFFERLTRARKRGAEPCGEDTQMASKKATKARAPVPSLICIEMTSVVFP